MAMTHRGESGVASRPQRSAPHSPQRGFPRRAPQRMPLPAAYPPPSAQRTRRALPRLGSPPWNPLSEAPPPEKEAQGGEPILPQAPLYSCAWGPFGGALRAAPDPGPPFGARSLRSRRLTHLAANPLSLWPLRQGPARRSARPPAASAAADCTAAGLQGVRRRISTIQAPAAWRARRWRGRHRRAPHAAPRERPSPHMFGSAARSGPTTITTSAVESCVAGGDRGRRSPKRSAASPAHPRASSLVRGGGRYASARPAQRSRPPAREAGGLQLKKEHRFDSSGKVRRRRMPREGFKRIGPCLTLHEIACDYRFARKGWVVGLGKKRSGPPGEHKRMLSLMLWAQRRITFLSSQRLM